MRKGFKVEFRVNADNYAHDYLRCYAENPKDAKKLERILKQFVEVYDISRADPQLGIEVWGHFSRGEDSRKLNVDIYAKEVLSMNPKSVGGLNLDIAHPKKLICLDSIRSYFGGHVSGEFQGAHFSFNLKYDSYLEERRGDKETARKDRTFRKEHPRYCKSQFHQWKIGPPEPNYVAILPMRDGKRRAVYQSA